MGLLGRSRPRDATDEPTDDAEAPTEADAGSEQADGTNSRRRWLLLGVVAAVVVALVLRSKRRAAREARFTEIELDTVDGDSGTESEQSAE